MKNLVNDENPIEKVDVETIEQKKTEKDKSDNSTLIIGIIVIVLIIGIAIYLKTKDVEPETDLEDANIS